MGTKQVAGPGLVLDRLKRAMNEHDLEGFLANVGPDYRSEQPAHPERAFGGREQVRENWEAIFRDVPDFRADLLRSAVDRETIWAEWDWGGTRTDGSRLEMSGVTIFGVRAERIVWGRLYMEMIEAAAGDIREAMKRMTAGAPSGAEASAGHAAEAQPSPTEHNKLVARRFGEAVWGQGDVDAADEVLAEDFIEHNPAPGQRPGRGGHKDVVKLWRVAFPDLTIAVDDALAEGDRVALRWTAHATHQGELMGRPATGRGKFGHQEQEVVLTGGDMTAVVRVGDTVRRSAGPWTPTIHAFMRHLRASGFRCVPEPLGIDHRGREIISLLPGAPATYPLPDFAWTDATLVAVARTLRAFHDASLGFAPPTDPRWQWPPHKPAEVLCHNDFGPYNLMFEDGQLIGVIDLDLASPGPRVWDMAYAAYRFVPLTDPANPDAPFPGAHEQRRRLAAFCAAYDEPRIAPRDVLAAAAAKLRELVHFIERAAAAGDPAQQAVRARGDVALYERDIAYIQRLP